VCVPTNLPIFVCPYKLTQVSNFLSGKYNLISFFLSFARICISVITHVIYRVISLLQKPAAYHSVEDKVGFQQLDTKSVLVCVNVNLFNHFRLYRVCLLH